MLTLPRNSKIVINLCRRHHEISEAESVPSKIFGILSGLHIKISLIAIVFQILEFQLYFSFVE